MDHVPLARRSRIDVWHYYHPVSSGYLTLQAGIFVVPVFYHDVGPAGEDYWATLFRFFIIRDIFWGAPSTYYNGYQLNSIWQQAGVQFHLVGMARHDLATGVASNGDTSDCSFDWDPPDASTYNVDNAVDLYRVNTIDGASGTYGMGFFSHCGMRGHLAITDLFPGPTEWLIGHEFGHYLAALPHQPFGSTALMRSPPNSGYISSSLADLARSRIAQLRVGTDPHKDYEANK